MQFYEFNAITFSWLSAKCIIQSYTYVKLGNVIVSNEPLVLSHRSYADIELRFLKAN